MKKKFVATLSVAMLSSALVFGGQAIAAPSVATWTNSTLTNWDKPISGSFTAEKISSTLAYNQLDFWWSSSQVTYMQDNMTRNLPTFDFRDNGRSALDSGGGASTDLPDPKFDFEDDNGDGKIDEIEVVSRGKEDIVALADYQFYASWSKSGTANAYMIAYSSMSARLLFPGGDHNTIPGSTDSLAGHWWNDLSTMSFASPPPLTLAQKQQLAEQYDQQLETHMATRQLEQPNNSEEQDSKVSAAYLELKSANDLTRYVQQADNALSAIPSGGVTDFTITLNSPVSFSEISTLADEYDLADSIFYARAHNEDGKRFTIALTALNQEALNTILTHQNLEFSGFIEIEGKASGEVLRSIKQNESNIFAVEASTEEFQPSGLYWKLENSRK
ncbi:hypothetical protein MKZ19_21610 [Shouchella clausii]|uniref:hypothetical protein n=1 Tax=Shouchella clausii TaxID=79880 RepID=UPI002DB73F50|nr:hypothetical protein [Shouchella clausii]MEB5482253.1 hypothetical protein [Shouchella clausii]